MRRKSLWSSPVTRFPRRDLQVSRWWSPALKRKGMKLSWAFVPTSELSLIPGLFCYSCSALFVAGLCLVLPSDCFNLGNFTGTIHWGCSLWIWGSHGNHGWTMVCSSGKRRLETVVKAQAANQSGDGHTSTARAQGNDPVRVWQPLVWWHWCGDIPCSHQRHQAGPWSVIILLSVLLMLNHRCRFSSEKIDLLIVLSCPVLRAHLQRIFWVRASLLPAIQR